MRAKYETNTYKSQSSEVLFMSYAHISEASQLEAAKKRMYERLANFIIKKLDIDRVDIAFEAGCGSGQLTISIAKKISGTRKLIAYDSWSGPYQRDLGVLRCSLASEGLTDKVKIIKGNVKQIGIVDEKVDLIFSNELFCDLDRNSSELTLKEFHRILKRGGQMVHAELDPKAENKAQELLIKADLHYSLEPLPFEGERWFSPTVDELSTLVHKNGFRNIQVGYFETNLKLGYEATVEQLKRWKIDMVFVKEHRNELKKCGIEYPKEHVIKCVKR